MKFKDIPKFPHCSYRTTVPWVHLEMHIKDHEERSDNIASLNLEPDFQRAHVWTEEQQIAYIEYQLRGGISAKDLYFNCAGWMKDYRGPYVIVDGKQRLQAVRLFLANKIPAFGTFFNQFEDKLSFSDYYFNWNIAALDKYTDILQWYLDFNSGGTQHSKDDLAKVIKMLESAKEK